MIPKYVDVIPEGVPNKVVEYDAYSVIPSVACLSSGKQTDPRLKPDQTVTPHGMDIVDIANFAKNYRSRIDGLYNKFKSIRTDAKKVESSSEPSGSEPTTE